MMKYILAFVFVFISNNVFAEKFEEVRHIKRVFSGVSPAAGFYTVEGLPQECIWGIMFIDLSTETGRALFSIVLTAKSLNWEIKRMDYFIKTETFGTTCNITAIHAE